MEVTDILMVMLMAQVLVGLYSQVILILQDPLLVFLLLVLLIAMTGFLMVVLSTVVGGMDVVWAS